MEGLFLDSMPPAIQNKFKDHFIKGFIKRIDWMNQRILSIKEELNNIYTLANEPINWLDEKNDPPQATKFTARRPNFYSPNLAVKTGIAYFIFFKSFIQ
jgi:hypothetical protein